MTTDLLQCQLYALLASISRQHHRLLGTHDSDSLHDLRIALRSLRALLPLQGKKPRWTALRERWHRAAASTNHPRDLDVQCELLARLLPGHPLVARLGEAAMQAQAQLQADLASPEWEDLLQDSNRLFARSGAISQAQLLARQKKLRRRLGIHLAAIRPDSPAAQWHALRLDIKRLRYLLDAGSTALPDDDLALLQPLKRAQSRLGDLHDLDNLLLLGHYTEADAQQIEAARKQALLEVISVLPELAHALGLRLQPVQLSA
ncbi:CHAD domain-containing protein [Chitinilyticum aquatile]|uniref:CHAD domain-containing protein n=1 Tax=Chitinilyticum aquatile TaxID=362520 RepID=UPI0003F68E5F|nr:CHAD domain-containing protein [Chitinilyticum aquatile]